MSYAVSERKGVTDSAGPGEDPVPLARLARYRESTYRLLSRTFLYPDEERLSAAAEDAGELRVEGATSMARFAFFGGWIRLLGFLEDFGGRRTEDLQRDYVSLFVANVQGVPCPPYESVYREPSGRPTAGLLAQVERAYAAAGLAPSPDLGELPDHVAVEMEFMAVLCGQEAEAWRERDQAGGIEALRKQMSFLDSHLSLWLPEFLRRLASADSGRAYAVAGEGAQAFIGYDRDLLDVLVEATSGGGEEAAQARGPSAGSA